MAQPGTPLTVDEFALIKAAVAAAAAAGTSQQQQEQQRPLPTVQTQNLHRFGRELLQHAADGKVARIRELIGQGAPFTTDWLGTSALHMAAMYGHYEVAKVLLEAGISRDARTKVDKAPLHLAATEGFTNIVELLLVHKAEVNCRDMLNMTPLHWAVERAHVNCIEWLLRCGADIDVNNKFDKDPRDIASDNGHPGIMEMLDNYEVYRADNPLRRSSADAASATEDAVNSILPHLDGDTADVKRPPPPAEPEPRPEPEPELPVLETPDNSADGMSTLAAIAEAAATARRTGKKEALQLLASHGITMLPVDDPSTVPAALTSGKTISLTAAGALALGLTRPAIDSVAAATAAAAPRASIHTSIATTQANRTVPTKVPKVIKLTPEQFAQLTGLKSGQASGKAPLQLKLPLSSLQKTGKPSEPSLSPAKRLKLVPVSSATSEAASRVTVSVTSAAQPDAPARASPESTAAPVTSSTDVVSLRTQLATAEREAARLRQLCREREAEAERCRRLLAAAGAEPVDSC